MKKNLEITARTRQRLIDSFWKLLEENGLSKITVTSITREAGYNRGTFYEYFKDIPDLLENIENELMEDLLKQIDSLFGEKTINLPMFSQKFASILVPFDDKLFFLLGENGDSTFSYRFMKDFINGVAKHFDFGENSKYKEYILSYCYSAVMGIKLHWYENERNLPFDELISIAQSLVATGLFGFIGQDYKK